jgi:hypothetical protein
MIGLGFSLTGEDSPIISPFGSNPSYVSLMQRTFNQAGEKALLLSLSYAFANVGVEGLSAILTETKISPRVRMVFR